jgi:hypothetical protein
MCLLLWVRFIVEKKLRRCCHKYNSFGGKHLILKEKYQLSLFSISRGFEDNNLQIKVKGDLNIQTI